ncbi:MAG: DUF1501 domain-containing protein, partial [Verrucomicrobiales bacterium]|nr:DUF1501 domain-containing protein [Verrucomicrobiales bacterium]
MNRLLGKADEVTRRSFMSGAAKSFLGVGLSAGLMGRLGGAVTSPEEAAALYKGLVARKRPAKKVIYLYMSGGMSHLDTLNPRPDAGDEYRGEVEAIKTSADGVRISEYLPGLAKHMHQAVLFNSLHSTQGAHQQGNYLMHTNYVKRGTIQHPHIGAWHLKQAGRINEQLPGFIRVGGGSRDQGAGFFDTTFEPLSIRDPKAGLKFAKHYGDVGGEEFARRVGLSNKLGYDFRNRYEDKGVKAYTSMYEEAVRLMKSEDLEAFDLSKESAETRDLYGEGSFGQGCLLARRLVENGVRFVEVQLGGWDTHTDNFVRVPERTAMLDRGLTALLGDLESRGQLDETMVVLATEFGRTPKINQNAGRDHFPKCLSAMIAGGGIRGG